MTGRRLLLTEDIFALIPQWVSQNMCAEEISARVGCTVTTLRVKCSQRKISLRTPNWKERQRSKLKALWLATTSDELPKATRFPKPVVLKPHKPLPVTLDRVSLSLLRQQADAVGMTVGELAAKLLETIARDGLSTIVLKAA